MRIITNEKLIKRNATIGRVASLLGLAILALGMYITFRQPEQIGIAWIALLSGFALSQIGIYFGNRWGRRPRPDEQINDALKGLGENYTIYHYSSPVSHLLIGPAGIWALILHHQAGKIVYEKNRWQQKGGSFGQRYLRIFAQEGLGRPDLEVSSDINSINTYFRKNLPGDGTGFGIPSAQAVLVFTNEKAEIDVDEAPVPTLTAKKLKDFVRKRSKDKVLSQTGAQMIQEILEKKMVPEN
jgi:hypothetical protein